MHTVTSADGTDIAYERRGEGQPLILLHGTGGSRQSWYPVLPHLTDDFTTFVPDRRGRGESGDAQEYSLQREVEDIHAVVEAADEAVDGDPILFGHSFGGLISIEVARQTDLGGLVLYEPALMTGEHRKTADAAGRMSSLLDDGEREEAVKLAFREMADLEDVESLPTWPAVVEQAESFQREFEVVEEYQANDDLSFDVPALLLTGSQSKPFLRDGVRALHAVVEDSRLVEFDGVGHVFNEVAPDRVTEEIRSYVFDEA